jgi:hypothetical protein
MRARRADFCAAIGSAVYKDSNVVGAIDRRRRIDLGLRQPERLRSPIRNSLRNPSGKPGVAHCVPRRSPSRRDGDCFWEFVGADGERPVVIEIGDYGPWSPPMGAIPIYSSQDQALQGFRVLRPLWLTKAGNYSRTEPAHRLRRIPDLQEWMKSRMVDSDFRGAPFVIDVHCRRDALQPLVLFYDRARPAADLPCFFGPRLT